MTYFVDIIPVKPKPRIREFWGKSNLLFSVIFSVFARLQMRIQRWLLKAAFKRIMKDMTIEQRLARWSRGD